MCLLFTGLVSIIAFFTLSRSLKSRNRNTFTCHISIANRTVLLVQFGINLHE